MAASIVMSAVLGGLVGLGLTALAVEAGLGAFLLAGATGGSLGAAAQVAVRWQRSDAARH